MTGPQVAVFNARSGVLGIQPPVALKVYHIWAVWLEGQLVPVAGKCYLMENAIICLI